MIRIQNRPNPYVPPGHIIKGEYPKAIEISDSKVLLLHNKGAGTFGDNGSVAAITTDSKLITDQYSSLFRLDQGKLVLVSQKELLINVFKEDTRAIIATLKTKYTYSGVIPYCASVISPTSFIVSFNNTAIVFEFNDKTITEKAAMNLESFTYDLTCAYYPKENVFFCASTKKQQMTFEVYDMQLKKLISKTKGKAIEGWKGLIKLVKDNIFSVCYYGNPVTLYCMKVSVIHERDSYEIINTIPEVVQGELEPLLHYPNMLVIKKSVFAVGMTYSHPYLNHVSISGKMIGKPQMNERKDLGIRYPSIFSIGNDIVGYVHHTQYTIRITIVRYPLCENVMKYTQINTRNSLSLKPLAFKEINSLSTMFYEFPTNALITQNNELVFPDKLYHLSFEYSSFKEIEEATWLYSTVYKTWNNSIGSALCDITIRMCYPSCEECLIGGNLNKHQCTKCIDKYSFDSQSPTNCIRIDGNNKEESIPPIELKCYKTCKTCSKAGDAINHKCDTCLKDHYPLEDNRDQCETGQVDYYFLDKEIYRKCFNTCKTCSSIGSVDKNNCITCKGNLIISPTEKSQCVTNCKGSLWYISLSTKEAICMTETKCPTSHPFLIEKSQECAISCLSEIDEDCMTCKSKRLYEYQSKCIEKCPDGMTVNYQTNQCMNITDDKNKRIKKVIVEKQSNVTLNDTWNMKLINNYLKKLNTIMTDNGVSVDLIYTIIGTNFTIHHYKLSDSDIDILLNEHHSSLIDFSNIKKALFRESPYKYKEIIVIQLDLEQEEKYSNIAEYVLYDNVVKKLLDINSLRYLPITIMSPYNINEEFFIKKTNNMLKKGINIYDASSPFYNDMCFKFYSDQRRYETTLEIRINNYYPNKELCKSGCDLLSIDEEDKTILCQCQLQNDEMSPIDNNSFMIPLQAIPTYAHQAIHCYKEVFNTESIITNYGFLICISAYAIICLFDLWFKCKSTTLCKSISEMKVRAILNHAIYIDQNSFSQVNDMSHRPDESIDQSKGQNKDLIDDNEKSEDDKGKSDQPEIKMEEAPAVVQINKGMSEIEDERVIGLSIKSHDPDPEIDSHIDDPSVQKKHNNKRYIQLSENSNRPIQYQEKSMSFIGNFVRYLLKRELFLSSIFCFPCFISLPICFFLLTIIFTIQLIFFTNDFLYHLSYYQNSITIGAVLKNEIFKYLCAGILINIIQVNLTKTLRVFLFSHKPENNERMTVDGLTIKINMRCSLVFTLIKTTIVIFIYVIACYCGIYQKCQMIFLIGFVFCLVFSFLLTLFLCFYVNLIRWIGMTRGK